MVERFKETGHPVIKSISALSRGILKRKGGREPYTSMRIHRLQSSCFAQLLSKSGQSIREQFQAGVKSSV